MIENYRKMKKEEARDASLIECREDIDNNISTTNIVFTLLAESGAIDEVTATEHLNVFAYWEPNISYTVGQLRVYGDEPKLYKCIQAHTSQSDWTPDTTAALWKLAGNPLDEWPEWSQPIGATDAYMSGDKVSYNNRHWISSIDNNAWQPGVYGWDAVSN